MTLADLVVAERTSKEEWYVWNVVYKNLKLPFSKAAICLHMFHPLAVVCDIYSLKDLLISYFGLCHSSKYAKQRGKGETSGKEKENKESAASKVMFDVIYSTRISQWKNGEKN